MKRKLASLLLVLISLTAVITACGGSTEKEASKELTKVRVGHLPIPGQIIYYIAQEQGYFEEEGLEVEFSQIKKSADVMNSLKAGKIDVGSAGTAAPLLFIADNSPFVIAGGILAEGSEIVTTPDKAAKIKSVKDLAGKKLGTVRLATGDIVLRAYLQRQGIDPKSIEWVEFASATDSLTALKSGKVDAAISWPPYTDVEVLNGSIAVVVPTGELVDNHPCCRVVFSKDFLQANPEVAKGFLKALIKAEKYFTENPEESLKFAANTLKIDEKEIRGTLVDNKTSVVSANPNKNVVVDFWNMMKEVGYLESDHNVHENIDTTHYEKALQELAAKSPNEQFYKDKINEFQSTNK